MMLSPDVRGRMIVVLVLALGLVAALIGALSKRPVETAMPFRAEWAGLPLPSDLPGSPANEGPSAAPTPPPIVGLKAAERNMMTPFASLGVAARPFNFVGTPQDRMRAETCLTAAMLYEAGGDAVGQLAVAQVVLNRVRHPAFPASVCGVVTQGSDRATGCQFTFTCDGALARSPSPSAVRAARARADAMLSGFVVASVGLATHYHTDQVYPWWSPKLEKIARVGSHLFFRWPGLWGSSRALQGKRLVAEPSTTLFLSMGDMAGGEVPVSPRIDVQSDLPVVAQPTSSNASFERSPVIETKTGVTPAIPTSRRLVAPGSPSTNPAAFPGTSIVGGNRLLHMAPESGTYFLQLAPAWTEAQVRRAAITLCGGRVPCHVYGWRDARQAPVGGEMTAAAQSLLAFRYVKEAPRKAPSNAPVAQIF